MISVHQTRGNGPLAALIDLRFIGPWVSGVTVASAAHLRGVENGELYPGAEQSDRVRSFRNGFSIVETTGRPNWIANGKSAFLQACEKRAILELYVSNRRERRRCRYRGSSRISFW